MDLGLSLPVQMHGAHLERFRAARELIFAVMGKRGEHPSQNSLSSCFPLVPGTVEREFRALLKHCGLLSVILYVLKGQQTGKASACREWRGEGLVVMVWTQAISARSLTTWFRVVFSHLGGVAAVSCCAVVVGPGCLLGVCCFLLLNLACCHSVLA